MATTPATTTVRGAVERAENAPKTPSMAQVVRQAIDDQTAAMALVLPGSHDAERFSRLVLTAVKATPKLMECFATPQGRTSVLLSAMQLATVGLEPNTATEEAWLLPRKNKGVMECEAAIGYRGLLKLARRSGEIKSVYAEAVRANDHFVWARGIDADTLEFRQAEGTEEDRGELTHAFAVVRYLNGGADFVVLTRSQVERRRDASTSYQFAPLRSPWTTSPESMWRKSALRELSKTMPLTSELASALERDERPLTMDSDGLIVASVVDDELPALDATTEVGE